MFSSLSLSSLRRGVVSARFWSQKTSLLSPPFVSKSVTSPPPFVSKSVASSPGALEELASELSLGAALQPDGEPLLARKHLRAAAKQLSDSAKEGSNKVTGAVAAGVFFPSPTPGLPHGTLSFFLDLTFESCFFMFSLTHPSFSHMSHFPFFLYVLPFFCAWRQCLPRLSKWLRRMRGRSRRRCQPYRTLPHPNSTHTYPAHTPR